MRTRRREMPKEGFRLVFDWHGNAVVYFRDEAMVVIQEGDLSEVSTNVIQIDGGTYPVFSRKSSWNNNDGSREGVAYGIRRGSECHYEVFWSAMGDEEILEEIGRFNK